LDADGYRLYSKLYEGLSIDQMGGMSADHVPPFQPHSPLERFEVLAHLGIARLVGPFRGREIMLKRGETAQTSDCIHH
jgi:hypothetical protein